MGAFKEYESAAWPTVSHMSVSSDEVAAALASIQAYLAHEQGQPLAVERPSAAWRRAGRLESLQLPVTRDSILRGWRV